MKYLPPLKSLHYFSVAARLQSFKQAAQELHVTQAAVSQQIKLLESHLELPLFERRGRQTRLTPVGEELLPHIHSAFDTLSRGVASVMADPRPDRLCISALHSLTSIWLIPRLQEFQLLHPDLTVQLVPTNTVEDFSSGDIDLAIRMSRDQYPPLEQRFLLQEQIILVASPALLNTIDTEDPHQVLSLPWLQDTCMEAARVTCCEQFDFPLSKVNAIMASDNAVPLIAAAVAGQGIALVNQGMVAESVRQGELLPLLEFICDSDYAMSLVAPEAHFKRPKVKAFEAWFVPRFIASFS